MKGREKPTKKSPTMHQEKKNELPKSVLEVFLATGAASDEFDPTLGLQEKSLLAQLSKGLNEIFQPQVDAIAETELLELIATAILDNKYLKTVELLTDHPNFIFKQIIKVKDQIGDTYQHVSPFQLAWDTKNDDLCFVMKGIIDKLPNGKQEAIRQLNEWFSETHYDKPTFDYDFNDLITAIKSEDFMNVYHLNPRTQAAIDKFQKDFSSGIIRDEHHFNIQILRQALDVYERQFKKTIYEHIYIKHVLIHLWKLLPAKDKLAFPPEKIFSSNSNGFFDFQPKLKKKLLVDTFRKYCVETDKHLTFIKNDLFKNPKPKK